MLINNIEYIKTLNIICINKKEKQECFNILEKLGFNVERSDIELENYIVIHYGIFRFFCFKDTLDFCKNILFKDFKKQTKKFLKDK